MPSEDGNRPTDEASSPKGVIVASVGWRSWQTNRARVAQLVEHVLGKDEVIGSSPIAGSIRSQNLLESEFVGIRICWNQNLLESKFVGIKICK